MHIKRKWFNFKVNWMFFAKVGRHHAAQHDRSRLHQILVHTVLGLLGSEEVKKALVFILDVGGNGYLKGLLNLHPFCDSTEKYKQEGGGRTSKWSLHIAKSESNQFWSILYDQCRNLAAICLNTKSKKLHLWQVGIQALSGFLLSLEGTHRWKSQWLCRPYSPDFTTYLMGIHEVHDKIEVSMHGLVFSQLRLHFVQPVNQGLQSIHELAWKQQGLLQLVLPEKSTQTSPLLEILLWKAHNSGCWKGILLEFYIERNLHVGMVRNTVKSD